MNESDFKARFDEKEVFEKLERQKLIDIEQKNEQRKKLTQADEWSGKRDVRHKTVYSRKVKHVGRFTYDLEEEGD